MNSLKKAKDQGSVFRIFHFPLFAQMGLDTLGQVQMGLASGSLRAVTNECGSAVCCFLISTESLKMSHLKSDALKFRVKPSAKDGNQQHMCGVPQP